MEKLSFANEDQRQKCNFLKGVMMIVQQQEFSKVVMRLDQALNQAKNDFMRDSVILRFELTIELAWKTCKKAMGTMTSAPKDVIREMGQSGYIENVELWLKSIDMRNASSQTYKEELAEIVYAFAKAFLPELQKLVSKLDKK